VKYYPLRKRTAIKLETNCTKYPAPSRSERTIVRDRTSFVSRYAASERANMVQLGLAGLCVISILVSVIIIYYRLEEKEKGRRGR
jgi:hypothetical protein